jgi:hexosaminidase
VLHAGDSLVSWNQRPGFREAKPADRADADFRRYTGQDLGVHPAVIPAPAKSTSLPASFIITPDTRIVADPGIGATRLAALLRRPTGFTLPLTPVSTGGTGGGTITLSLDGPPDLSQEGYLLDVDDSGVRLRAYTDEGLFRGTQTLRQLLPADVERDEPGSGPWIIPGVRIEDRPRFAWRGIMLDVARHFFGVREVKRLIDLVVPYKINVLHLHLTDDQGWRLAVDGWPRLATYGGAGEVGGGSGGFYTKADYTEIVRYAAERYVMVVPEIDLPGHTNAALASYPELNTGGVAPERYTGIEVGFSSLSIGKELTYRFVDQVLGEVAELTPGPYLHIGGDEAQATDPAEYATFLQRVERIVRAHGKTMVGWQEIGSAPLTPGNVVQHWRPKGAVPASKTRELVEAVRGGARLIMSPAQHTYLDLKYDPGSRLGQDWAGTVETRQSYEWDPVTLLDGVRESDVLGVEAALWTETITSWNDIAHMTLPRLPGLAERGWSPAAGRSWDEYASRLAAHAPRWAAADLDFHRSPGVPWPVAE